ncbi:protein kinase [Nonomuraea phyllanthi]|uniref:serine/threonine-protein kinase n=1 Tax=Nonomuraea phyllanthi TaxID=2219224 RepID=UPI001293E051|nr:serine/threonine-protein kinase [Nonomuraea phyllanthi]QFY10334.1 protein kinase [Nonomuraea phyllanthi]
MTSSRVVGAGGAGRIGGHQVVRLLGEGGQGTVYLAESAAGARVAVKVLHDRLAADPEVRRRFLREAEVAASVAPFCTARVIGTGMMGEQPYIVSEYVPGPSLDELVKRDGPRTGGGLDRLAISTLTALASIHRAGIVHRDFKPANVILGPEGPVVIDFGIARTLDAMTTSHHLAGTPTYMSPEQLGDQPLTLASDMFSWAATMVFAATGRRAFTGSSVPAIMHSILHNPPDLSGVPEPLRAMVAACLAKNPADRPTAEHLLRALTSGDAATEHTLVDKAPSTARNGAAVRRGRSRGPLLAAGAVLVALAVTAGVMLGPSWPAGNGSAGERAAATAAPLVIGQKAYPEVDVADDFDGSSADYDGYQPYGDEAMPVIKAGGGRLTGEGQKPFFGWFALPGAPSSGDTVSMITLGAFAGTGEQEDSAFVGRIKDKDNYIGAWYNNTREEIGIDVRVNGEFRHEPNSAALSLTPGDSLALVLSGGTTITSYAKTGGTWRRLTTARIDVLTTPQERARWRHGFGLRGTAGTIALDAAEGRGAAG